MNSLNDKNFEIDINHEMTTTLYVSVTTEGLPIDENIHKEHRQKLSSILVSLINEFRDDYYSSDDKRDMFEAITRIKKVYDHIDLLDNYYKFQSDPTKEWNLLMIDQPEDNISNNRIAEKLLKYFNSVRTTKQLIIVTHNPLLVVNLDVDNVIHLTKLNDKIGVKAGCLEDEKNEILNLVASTLDGGKK